jgi:hypothetical protein
MRIAKGRVVGKTVVIDEILPEGTEVEVYSLGSATSNDWGLSKEMWQELEASDEERDGDVSAAEAVAVLRAMK